MPIISFIEENKATFTFLAAIFVAVGLISIVILLKLPFEIERMMTFSATWLTLGGVFYFIIQGVRSMWEDPEAELWEWVLYFGLFFGLVFSIALLGFGYESPINITKLFG